MRKSGDPEGSAFAAQLTKKAAATRHYPINLHHFFPPDDEFATCVARLLILREDICLEYYGITTGPYEWLDKNGVAWRHNYFFRNSVRTLQEISSALQMLNCVQEFKRAMKKTWSVGDQKKFKAFCKEIQSAGELVTEVRNIIGAHVKHSVVARALNLLGSDATGFWEYPHDPDDKPWHTHHPFLNVIFLAMLQAGDKQHRDIDELMKIPGTTPNLLTAIAHIDNIVQLYVAKRRLLP